MTIEVTVGTTPASLQAALGLAGYARTVTPDVRLQNRGPATVYRATGPAAPDPAALRGFRHPAGDVSTLVLRSDVHDWMWTSAGVATLVVEL